MVSDPALVDINRRLDGHRADINSKVPTLLYDRDMRELRDDFKDLRESYKRLVQVAIGEAFGLLIAVVLIAVQLALSLGTGS